MDKANAERVPDWYGAVVLYTNSSEITIIPA